MNWLVRNESAHAKALEMIIEMADPIEAEPDAPDMPRRDFIISVGLSIKGGKVTLHLGDTNKYVFKTVTNLEGSSHSVLVKQNCADSPVN